MTNMSNFVLVNYLSIKILWLFRPVLSYTSAWESVHIDGSTTFRILFIILFSLLTLMRTAFKIRYGVFRDHALKSREGYVPVIIRWILGIPLGFSTFLYILLPEALDWMYLPLLPAGRYAGAVAGYFCLFLLLRVHLVLGDNFSTTLVENKQHALIRTGPYRYIRHPMYTAYFFLFVAAFLISGNWVIGLSGTLVIISLMTVRLKREEALLVERYGDEYLGYAEEVGRFFPRLGVWVVRAVRSRWG